MYADRCSPALVGSRRERRRRDDAAGPSPGLDGIAATRRITADPELRDCRVIGQFAHRPAAAPTGGARLATLTARELEVVGLVATGLSNEDIARELMISPLTAKTHITRAIAKLGVRDRVQLVILAYGEGLVG